MLPGTRTAGIRGQGRVPRSTAVAPGSGAAADGWPAGLAPRNRRADPQAEGAEATGGATEPLGVKNWYQQQVDGPQPSWAVDKTNTAHRKKEVPVPSLLAHSWGPANASK